MDAKTLLTATLAWLAFAVFAILNGIFREAALRPLAGDAAAQALSTLVLAGAILLATLALVARPWARLGPRALLGVGAGWMLGTVAFELLFGRYVMGASWASLLAAYDVAAGRIWAIIPLTLLLAPLLLRRALDARALAAARRSSS